MSMTSVDRVTEWVSTALRTGSVSPGQRLVEGDVAIRLGVARNSVREAMQRLAGQGIVTIERNRGPVVCSLSRSDVDEVFEIRERLEGLAARRAAQYLSALPVRALDATVEAAGESVERGDAVRYAALNSDFHDRIMKASRSDRLDELLTRLRLPIFRLQFRVLLTQSALQASHDDHLRIVDAIREGRVDAAEKAMRAHVRNAAKRIRSLPDDFFRFDPAGES